MKHEVVLGKPPDENAARDAVHVAVIPVVAGHPLLAGQHVGRREDGRFGDAIENLGIVDPFGGDPKEGDRFWLCLYPGSITSLRHVWTSPAFKVTVPGKSE